MRCRRCEVPETLQAGGRMKNPVTVMADNNFKILSVMESY